MPQMTTWAAMIGIAARSTALAYVLYFRLLASAKATNLLLVTFLIPASAVVLGSLVLGETLQARQVAGMLFIGLGVAAIDGRLWKTLRTGRAPDDGNASRRQPVALRIGRRIGAARQDQDTRGEAAGRWQGQSRPEPGGERDGEPR